MDVPSRVNEFIYLVLDEDLNAGLIGKEVICPIKYTWNTIGDWFKVWFEWHLCPLVNPGTVFVMDNASFHPKIKLQKIAEFYGCRIIWLPPYSPDKKSN